MNTSTPDNKSVGQRKSTVRGRLLKIAALAALTLACTSQAVAADAPASQPTTLISNGVGPTGNVTLMVNKSIVLTTRVPYKRVSIANAEVAEVNPVAPLEILIVAKKPGSTQLVVWDEGGQSQVVDLTVTFDLKGLQDELKTLFPRSNVEAMSANGAIVLKGRASDAQTAGRIAQVAAPYGANVLNFLEISGGQQVTLQVRFAEVSRSLTENLGFNAFATDGTFSAGINNGPGGNPVGGLASRTPGVTLPNVPLFGGGQIGATSFEFFVDALRQNNLLRVLAEPNLVAISGQKASFLAGGQFPVPVPQTNGGGGTAITVDYKEFGVRLNFTPTVLGNGHIRLDVAPEVSDLDFTNSVSFNGFVIPSVTTRNLSTTVELHEGQTLALAGLLANRVTANSSVTPLLGDIPVIGALFRSVRYVRDETELVVLVTPRVINPMEPGQVPPLPGEVWRYPTEAQLFGLADLGGPAPDTSHGPAQNPPPFRGRYGFTPAQAPAGQH